MSATNGHETKQAFSVKEKYEICLERQKQVQAGKNMRLEKCGLLFPDRSGNGISKATLSDILAMSDEILKKPPVEGTHEKKQRAPVCPVFEALLAEWIERAHAVPSSNQINDAIIQTQARSLMEELSGR
ncbi:hypothetical protein EV426DRAFT_711017 [Tirmania nivea]|nr:hypothetical protein EV426DRAFT_711017 [Tirmania nivea]